MSSKMDPDAPEKDSCATDALTLTPSFTTPTYNKQNQNQNTPSRHSQSTSGRKPWEEAKSWRSKPIQFGDMDVPGAAEPSSSLIQKVDGDKEPVKAKAVVSSPAIPFVPKGGFLWADEFDEEEVDKLEDSNVIKKAEDIESALPDTEPEENEIQDTTDVVEVSQNPNVTAGTEDIESAFAGTDPEEEDIQDTPAMLEAPDVFNVPELAEHIEPSPSMVSEDMPATPMFEQLPLVAEPIVQSNSGTLAVETDILEVIATTNVLKQIGDIEDAVSGGEDNTPINVPEFSEDIVAVKDVVVEDEEEVEWDVDGFEEPEHSHNVPAPYETFHSYDDFSGPSTPSQSTETPLDNELPVLTAPTTPALPVISYAQIAAAASAPASPLNVLKPQQDIEKVVRQTPIRAQPAQAQVSVSRRSPIVPVIPRTFEKRVSPKAKLEWESASAEALKEPKPWVTQTPKKTRASVTRPFQSPESALDNEIRTVGGFGVLTLEEPAEVDEEEEKEVAVFVLETPTKGKSKRRRTRSKTVRAALALAAADAVKPEVVEPASSEPTVVEAPIVEIETPAPEAFEIEAEVEVKEVEDEEIEEIEVIMLDTSDICPRVSIDKMVNEDGPAPDTWSSSKRLFLTVFALWVGYSCIYYLPDFLEWMKKSLSSENPDL